MSAGLLIPFITLDDVTHTFRERCKALSRDIYSLLPTWARNDADDILRKRKLMICGSTCRAEIRALARHAEIVGIVDDFATGDYNTGAIYNIPIHTTSVWIQRVKSDPSIVSCVLTPGSAGYNHFVRRCLAHDIMFLDPLQTLFLIKQMGIDTRREIGRFFVYGWEFLDFVLKNHEKLSKLSGYLDGTFSRFTWYCMLMYRLTLNPFYIDSCAVGMNGVRPEIHTYQINREFFTFSDQEVFVDGGTNIGNSIECFLMAVKGKFKHLYSFEPFAEHAPTIRARLDKLQDYYLDRFNDKVTLIQKGLWSCEGVLQFNPYQTHQVDKNFGMDIVGIAGGAHFIDSGMTEHIYDRATETEVALELPVTSIDHATGQDATFLKIEVEGSELQAIKGSVKTIERNRPKIALSVYHKPQDYLTLTEFMINLDMGYKFGFRHHNPPIPEATVLYCYK